MKRLATLATIAALFTASNISPAVIINEPEPVKIDVILDIYQLASLATGCPVQILRGIAFAESSFNPDAVGDGGKSIGLCQINEDFHADRVKLIGREYNPWCPLDNLIVAGANYTDNLEAFGDPRLAITAHKQGRTGAKAGEVTWYVERVLSFSEVLA